MAFGIHLAEAALITLLWLLTFRGWGEWLAAGKLIPFSPRCFRGLIRIVFGLGAFICFLLVFVYANIPLRYPCWIALVIGIGGLILMWKKPLRAGHFFPITRTRECFPTICLFTLIWLLQGLPVLRIGPQNYAALGHIDLYTYVSTSQFLVEKPFYSSPTEAINQPWIQNAIVLRHLRQGTNTILAYTSVVTGQDTQVAFGPLILFFTALTSVSVWFCLRQFALPPNRAWLFGVWAGLAHGITYSITASFLPSATVLFIGPFFAGLVWRYRRHVTALRLTPAFLIAYAFLTYTELFPWIFLFVLLVWAIPARWCAPSTWRSVAINALVFAMLILLYVPHAIDNQIEMWHTVSEQPSWFKLLSNASGSWQGWRQLFFATITSRSLPWLNAVTLLAALSFLGIIVGGLLIRRSDQNKFLVPMAVFIAFWPLLLLALPTFQPYAFFKLTITFLPFFYVLLAIGWHRLEEQFFQSGGRRAISTMILAGAIAGSLLSSSLFWTKIVSGQDSLPVNTPLVRAIRDHVRQHPEKIYYIDDPNELRAGWLAYYARHSQVHLSARTHLVWGFPANTHAMTPYPPYTILSGDTAPQDVPDYTRYEAR